MKELSRIHSYNNEKCDRIFEVKQAGKAGIYEQKKTKKEKRQLCFGFDEAADRNYNPGGYSYGCRIFP